ncbi:MAG: hypothetical protein KDA92_01150 [Planctomycetales bacterium]|nr:hypothetical protein [Planctomycetales bacterium]MCA9169926.1 hypothetical protein [Planctomycetales bacterium]
MRKRSTHLGRGILLIVVGLISWQVRLLAQPPEIAPATRNFMQAKLSHSQKVLEGLSLENYELIAKHAQELGLLSMESQWQVLRTQRYVDQSADFRHAIQHLVDAAKSKDIDAVALAYVDVTLKCVHCHKYVRDGGGREGISVLDAKSIDTGIAASP